MVNKELTPKFDTAKCNLCGLYQGKCKPTIPEHTYKYALVWDNPPLEETREKDRDGNIVTPFSSNKAKAILQALRKLGYDVEDFFLTYACSCATFNDRTPSFVEFNNCRDRFISELKIAQPEKIVTLGVGPFKALFGKDSGRLDEVRGIPQLCNEIDTWVLPTFDPAQCYHIPGMFLDLCNDLYKLGQEWPFPKIEPKCVVIDTIEKADWFFSLAYQNTTHVCDIETNSLNTFEPNTKLLSAGFTFDGITGYVFTEKMLYLNDVKNRLAYMWNSPGFTFINHTGIQFDAPYIKNKLGVDAHFDYDVLLENYLLDERGGIHSLDNILREQFGIPSWKWKAKQYVKGEGATYENIPPETLYEYNADDVVYTWHAHNKLLKQIKAEGKLDLLHRLQHNAKYISEMEQTGICVDKPYFLQLGMEWEMEAFNLTKKLQANLNNPKFNAYSPKQVATYLYDEMEYHQIKGRGTGREILEQLAEEYEDPNLNMMVDIRRLRHIKSAFIDNIMVDTDVDGRLRIGLLVHGTTTGRLSSKYHNIPKRIGNAITQGFVASPGYTLLNADFSQLQLRIAVWYSMEPNLIQAFNSGRDFHTETAAMMFRKAYEDVTSLERFAAKSVNFGILFGMQEDALSKKLGCSKETAKDYLEKYHTTNAALTKWINEVIVKVREDLFVRMPTGRTRSFPLRTRSNCLEIDREAVNTMIQSLEADICLDAIGRLGDTRPDDRIRLLFTIHDSILIECPTEILELTKNWMKKTMEAVPDMGYLKDCPIKMKVDVESGPKWGELRKDTEDE